MLCPFFLSDRCLHGVLSDLHGVVQQREQFVQFKSSSIDRRMLRSTSENSPQKSLNQIVQKKRSHALVKFLITQTLECSFRRPVLCFCSSTYFFILASNPRPYFACKFAFPSHRPPHPQQTDRSMLEWGVLSIVG